MSPSYDDLDLLEAKLDSTTLGIAFVLSGVVAMILYIFMS